MLFIHITMKEEKILFVTVGTTQFPELVHGVFSSDFIAALKKRQFTKMVVQSGKQKIDMENINVSSVMEIECYQLKASIREDMESASLVISHAGAGSVLETLALNKPLLVVINTALMDNHQTELAWRLSSQHHLYHTTCDRLVPDFLDADFSKLEPFTPADTSVFPHYLDKLMGMNTT